MPPPFFYLCTDAHRCCPRTHLKDGTDTLRLPPHIKPPSAVPLKTLASYLPSTAAATHSFSPSHLTHFLSGVLHSSEVPPATPSSSMLASKLCTDVVLRVQARRPPPAFFAQAPSSFLVSGRCRLRILVDKASVSMLPRLAVKLSRCWPAPSSPH
jgi:hypothetical protein